MSTEEPPDDSGEHSLDHTEPTNDRDEWWVDEDSHTDAQARATSVSMRSLVVAVAAALALGAAAVVAIDALGSSDSLAGNATAAGPGQSPTGAPPGAMGNGAFPGAPGLIGTISGTDGSTLTVEDQTGNATKVVTTDSTTVTQATSGSADDVERGDHVLVIGTSGTGNATAQRVVDTGDIETAGPGGPPNRGSGGPTSGTVKSVDHDSLTITTTDGSTVSVSLSSSTEFEIEHSASLSDLEIGDTVMVMGTTNDGTVTATNIRAGITLGMGPSNGMPGANA